MKKIYNILLAAVAILSVSSLTSCGDVWVSAPGPGHDATFYDRDLTGCYWELWQVNSQIVHPSEVNYLEFFGNGRGYYYYLRNNVPYQETMTYWCQYSGYGTSQYQINIRYANGSPTTMDYWFTNGGNYLCLQWYAAGYGTTTYVYRPVGQLPRPF